MSPFHIQFPKVFDLLQRDKLSRGGQGRREARQFEMVKGTQTIFLAEENLFHFFSMFFIFILFIKL